jgi:phosphoglycerate dehydrogenase-like enzyme
VSRVVFCSTGFPRSRALLRQRLSGSGILVEEADPVKPLEPQVRGASVLIPSLARISAAVMDAAAPSLRLIAQFGSGIEGVDQEAAAARGIPVRYAPGSNAQAVAELALFLMLALARGLPRHRRSFDRGTMGEPAGVELAGKTLGVVGLGHSGGRLATMARAIGMEVIAVRRHPAPHPAVSWVGGPADLDELLPRSDFVSLHLPLSADTRGIIGAARLASLKRTAFLVNVGRGPLVDREALVGALGENRLAGAGLDVFWEEPPDPADPLLVLDNVVATPHIGGVSEDFLQAAADRMAGWVLEAVRSE